MGLGLKTPVARDAAARATRLIAAYDDWTRRTEADLPVGEKLRRLAARIYRSKGERRQVADYYAAEFHIDVEAAPSPLVMSY
jgi:hypothetical protein